MICKNCGTNFSGKFCNECGQKSNVKRIDSNYLLEEIPNTIFQLNRGFFFTIKELSTRPGHSLREFISGKRVQHYKPIGFLIITATIFILSKWLTGENTIMADAINGFQSGVADSDSHTILSKDLADKIIKYEIYIYFGYLMLYALFTRLAFFKSGHNYFEHLIINLYIRGFQLIIYTVVSPFMCKDSFWESLPFLLGILYNFLVFNQFFKDRHWIANLGLILLVYCMMILSFFVLVFLMVILVN